MTTITYLNNITPHLDSFEDIIALKRLGKEFNEYLSSPEFAKYYHWRKHGYNPPDILYYWNPDEERLKEAPWRLEFSFIPLKFFFWVDNKLYINALMAYQNALMEKREWDSWFISTFFEIEVYDLERWFLVITTHDWDLTQEQMEYITDTYSEVVDELEDSDEFSDKDILSVLTSEYIQSLARYGDIDYFEEILRGLSSNERRKHIDTFTEYMVEAGKENLLEAYERYPPPRGKKVSYLPERYHPNQWKIEEVNKDALLFLAPTTKEELFRVIQEYPGEKDAFMVTSLLEDDRELLRWIIKNHPEVIPEWYSEIDNIYELTVFRGEKEDIDDFMKWYVTRAREAPEKPSFEEIVSRITFTDDGLEELITLITGNYLSVDYPLFFEILKWDRMRTITLLKKITKEAERERDVNVEGEAEWEEAYPSYSYRLLLAALGE